MDREDSDQQVYDALEKAQRLYERYLELSRIADIVPDDLDQPSQHGQHGPPSLEPLELIIRDIPTFSGSDSSSRPPLASPALHLL